MQITLDAIRAVPVSVVIPTHNRPERLAQSLQVLSGCDPRPAEVLIYFDGQTDGSSLLPADFPIPIKTFQSDTKMGPGGARNILVSNASHELVSSFDDDSFPIDSDFFESVVEVFDSLPDAGAVSASIRLPGQQHSPLKPIANQCRYFSGSGTTFRRSAILKTRGYVPLVGAYGMEETDMSLQLLATGSKVYTTTWLRVLHESQPSLSQRKKIAAISLKNTALLHYLRYPLILAPIGFYQWFRFLSFAKGFLSIDELKAVIGELPSYLKQHREFRHRYSIASVFALLGWTIKSDQPVQIVTGREKGRPLPTAGLAPLKETAPSRKIKSCDDTSSGHGSAHITGRKKTTDGPRVLIVGCPETPHVGSFFRDAAHSQEMPVNVADTRWAFGGNPVSAKFNWWIRGRVPNRLHAFSRNVLEQCRKQSPDILIATGTAPITGEYLQEIRSLGVHLVNYLTDDPWNPAHRSRWLMKALPEYDIVFSTRTTNILDLKNLGCREVQYLPFAYEPNLHYQPELSTEEFEQFQSDLAFVGGADRDRVPVLAKLIENGFNVSLWGAYWQRFPETRTIAHGQADPTAMRKVIATTSVALGLVRESNRDEHSMRTYEVAAIGAPMLVIDTSEHRKVFGPEGDCVLYFKDDGELMEKALWLRAHREEGRELASKVRDHIRSGANTYADRFNCMIAAVMS